MLFDLQYTDKHINANSGLCLVAKILQQVKANFIFKAHQISYKNYPHKYADTEVIKSMLGLILQGYRSYEHIDFFRNDKIFSRALGINKIPSKETLRQRLGTLANDNPKSIQALRIWNQALLEKLARPDPITDTDMIPVDFDVTVMNNNGSNKEGVKTSYKLTVAGFAPMMTNIGRQGYLLNHQFRPGNAHSNCEGTYQYILDSMQLARELCNEQKLLARFDSGNDSDDNIVGLGELDNVYFLIKHVIRGSNHKSTKETLIQKVIKEPTSKIELDNGSIRYFYEEPAAAGVWGKSDKPTFYPCRKIISVIEINNDPKTGQKLLIPDYKIHLWRTNLDKEEYSPQRVVDLYRDHATSEQFHAELKSDLVVERLPSANFKTNAFCLAIAQIAFNILRIIGDRAVQLEVFSKFKNRTRIRIATVLNCIIRIPGQLIRKNKRWTINLPRSHPLTSALFSLYDN